MDLSIIILNYKQKGLVKQCIKGILAAQPALDYELIIVDNASADDCLAMIRGMFHGTGSRNPEQGQILQRSKQPLPPHRMIQSKTNLGFAAGHNLGIAQAKGKYVLVINPDVAVVPGALEQMIECMKNNPTVGITGPRLINPDGSVQHSCRRFPNWRIPIYRRTIIGKLPFAKRALSKYLMATSDHAQSQAVDWLFGAVLLFRKELLDKIGLFDERFFVYFEDLDICRRAWDAGYSVWYDAEVEMVHYHQRLSAGGSGLLSIFKLATRIHLASGLKYFLKYFGAKLPKKLDKTN